MILAVKGAATIWKEAEGLTGAKLLMVLVVDQIFYFLMCVWSFVTRVIINHARHTSIV